MNQSIACIILRGAIYDWYIFLFSMAIMAVTFAARYRWFFVQWLDGIRGRDWTAVSAVIDVVSVVAQTESTRYGERIIGYLATLTYFYRNPELQMGEYSRLLSDENEAQVWSASYKGRNGHGSRGPA